jgi:protein SCO1/2/putative membrane protein
LHSSTKSSAEVRLQRVRTLIRALTLVLWILAIGAMFLLWRASANRNAVAPAIDQVQTDAGNSAEPATADAPIVLDPQPATEDEATGWDPVGIEDFSLTERNGRTVTKADLLGKPWAVCFVFTRCAGPCLGISAQMKKLHDQLKDVDVRFVTITVDPVNDTPEVLTRYADAFGADPQRWLFLTGDQQQIYHLIHSSFKMPVQEVTGPERLPGYEVLHTTNILLVDAEGRVVEKFNGTSDTEMVALRRALEQAAEASSGESDTQPSDQAEG